MNAPNNTPYNPLKYRLRYPASSRFKATDEFKNFARSYIPTFTPKQWVAFRQVLIDLFIFVEQGKVKGDTFKVCSRPLIDERKGSELRLYLTPEAHAALTKFKEPAEVLEVAYRFHQLKKDLGKVISEGKLSDKRDDLLNQSVGGAK
jgi:hypothetical protein